MGDRLRMAIFGIGTLSAATVFAWTIWQVLDEQKREVIIQEWQ